MHVGHVPADHFSNLADIEGAMVQPRADAVDQPPLEQSTFVDRAVS